MNKDIIKKSFLYNELYNRLDGETLMNVIGEINQTLLNHSSYSDIYPHDNDIYTLNYLIKEYDIKNENVYYVGSSDYLVTMYYENEEEFHLISMVKEDYYNYIRQYLSDVVITIIKNNLYASIYDSLDDDTKLFLFEEYIGVDALKEAIKKEGI